MTWRDFFQIVQSRENHRKGLKENFGRLIDFLSLISKLVYFNLLDLADISMHHEFPVLFLIWQSWGCANTAAHKCLQYVHHFEGFVHNGSHKPVSTLSSCTYNSNIIKNNSFLAFFMHILNSCPAASFKLSLLVFRHSSRSPSSFDPVLLTTAWPH